MPSKATTARELLKRARTPVFDVVVGEDGGIGVIVSGVTRPFRFYVSKGVLKDAAPFGVITKDVCMEVAKTLAEQQCISRGVLFAN